MVHSFSGLHLSRLTAVEPNTDVASVTRPTKTKRSSRSTNKFRSSIGRQIGTCKFNGTQLRTMYDENGVMHRLAGIILSDRPRGLSTKVISIRKLMKTTAYTYKL